MSEPAPGFQKHPDYEVGIEPVAARVRALVGETVIADTNRPLRVTETRHHPVWYLPLADIRRDCLIETEHTTYCPFKGTARYWTIDTGADRLENAVWAYPEPYAQCAALAGYAAFYTDRVRLEVDGKAEPERAPGFTEPQS